MMMKNPKVILSCLISIIMLATAASADWVPITDPVPLEDLPGGALIVGDKKFSNFVLSGFGTGGAVDPDFSRMTVQGGTDSETGDYGLKFDMFSWNAGSGQTVNVTMSFKASILPDYDYFIKDVWMYITGAQATGTGLVSAGENVWDVFPGGNVVASLSCSKQDNDGGAYLVDYAEFSPLKEIYIQSKSITITGGTNGTGGLDEFFQFYSQVPEPATIVLLGMAGIWVFTRKRRSA
jgi:hypothetical protein